LLPAKLRIIRPVIRSIDQNNPDNYRDQDCKLFYYFLEEA